MEVLAACGVGALFAVSVFLLLQRTLFQLALGMVILTNAINLLVFLVGGLTVAAPPLVPAGADGPPARLADPLPQALVLTAIVINFGVMAFTLVLVYRAHHTLHSDALDDLDAAEGTARRDEDEGR